MSIYGFINLLRMSLMVAIKLIRLTGIPFRIALWDYDHSFGRDGDNELNMMKNAGEPKRSEIIRRLMEIPGSSYPDKLQDRSLAMPKSGHWTTNGIMMIRARMKKYN